MRKLTGFFLAAWAAVLFSAPASAGGDALLALNLPAKPQVSKLESSLKDKTTAQARVTPAGYTDFDAFSSVNDPLYREGSKELLKQVIEGEAGKTRERALKKDPEKDRPAKDLRDAPASGAEKPEKDFKRVKQNKPVHADPVKAKNTL